MCSYQSFSLSCYLQPQIIFPAATLDPRPRHWTRDRDFGPATATLDPRPATRDPRLLVKLCFEWFQHCSNIATLCCAKNRLCESSRVTLPLNTALIYKKTSHADVVSSYHVVAYPWFPFHFASNYATKEYIIDIFSNHFEGLQPTATRPQRLSKLDH